MKIPKEVHAGMNRDERTDPEMDVGPFFFTQANQTYQLMDPTQPTLHTPM